MTVYFTFFVTSLDNISSVAPTIDRYMYINIKHYFFSVLLLTNVISLRTIILTMRLQSLLFVPHLYITCLGRIKSGVLTTCRFKNQTSGSQEPVIAYLDLNLISNCLRKSGTYVKLQISANSPFFFLFFYTSNEISNFSNGRHLEWMIGE